MNHDNNDDAAFQSPSLRGSGRFNGDGPRTLLLEGRFNPLHCGAVVASRPRPTTRPTTRRRFNPLHCGAVVASYPWPGGPEHPPSSFNPLHCGAVVASQEQSKQSRLCCAGFNPLHCGAVVASNAFPPRRGGRAVVSIPFIAGQWSLQGGKRMPIGRNAVFQSPSLRGSGRFAKEESMTDRYPVVSIPFIAGQWSLLPRTTPSSLFGVLLRKRRLPCDHIICTRLPF